ncbi:putative reverse transcriptase domain-containing protein, partial [Tanacetum coccineum]
MAISVISVSLDSSEESVGMPAGRVILFGTIPTTIPDTTPTVTPPITHADTTLTPTEIPTILPTISPSPNYTPASPDYTPALPDYLPASDTESDPSEDPSSDHIPPLPATSPFLPSTDDTTNSDTPDTPPSPTHGIPFTEITPSTQRSPVASGALRRRLEILLQIPRQRHHQIYSLRHSLSDHSSLDSPHDLPSTSARPSRKRHRPLITSVPALSPLPEALSSARANLLPLPKRIRDSGYLSDVEVDSRESSEPSRSRETDVGVYDVETVDEPHSEPEFDPVQATIDACFDFADIIKIKGLMVTHLVVSDDVQETAQEERAVEGMYETLGSLVQRFHDHTVAIPVHRRVAELERDNSRLRGTLSSQRNGNGGHRGNENEGGGGGNVNGRNGNGGHRGNENEGNGGNGNGGRNGNGNRNGNHGMNNGGFMPMARECTFQDFLKCKPHNFSRTEGVRTIGVDAAYAMRWTGLMKLMTEVYCPRNEDLILLCTRMVPDEEDRVERFIGGSPDNFHGNVIAANPTRLQDAIRIANQLMDKKLQGYAARNAKNKRRLEMWKAGHIRKDCPKLRNQNRGNNAGNKTGNNEATARAYAISGEGDNPDSNIVTGTFLINNYYASMLFDSGADRSFMSSTFSALLDVAPSTLDTSYAVELANIRISKTNVILRGCTLGLLGHSFDIDLMPIELGSFDVIIGMDWLAKYHAVIVCNEKIVCILYGDEMLIIRSDDIDGGSKLKLNIISCTKTQKYIEKGCQVYLAQVTCDNHDLSMLVKLLVLTYGSVAMSGI